jgi:hypothetical protein
MKFRPSDLEPFGDPDPDSPVEWEDNGLSNFMAWFSHRFLRSWCQTPQHWTSRLTQYLWTDCPCCLLFRGIVVGLVEGVVLGIVIGVVVTNIAMRLP